MVGFDVTFGGVGAGGRGDKIDDSCGGSAFNFWGGNNNNNGGASCLVNRRGGVHLTLLVVVTTLYYAVGGV